MSVHIAIIVRAKSQLKPNPANEILQGWSEYQGSIHC